ncbi:hypothetical protein BOA8489_01440 [Boseongicola aestuarii]|uniref:Uncharacterized protein n=1 Tax=Boseongicola aestuarii TaxID=1470561 RepID=A0A238IZM2_9RHOB|nr:hypothetical protein BOA8489_01440 [Boseongicola aestuarii]
MTADGQNNAHQEEIFRPISAQIDRNSHLFAQTGATSLLRLTCWFTHLIARGCLVIWHLRETSRLDRSSREEI